MGSWACRKDLHDLRNRSWAYLQPDCGWGWRNSGFNSDAGENLLVDTLFDLPLAAEMLATLRYAHRSLARIASAPSSTPTLSATIGIATSWSKVRVASACGMARSWGWALC